MNEDLDDAALSRLSTLRAIEQLTTRGYTVLPRLLPQATIERGHVAMRGLDFVPVEHDVITEMIGHPAIVALLEKLCERWHLDTRGGSVRRMPFGYHVDPLWWDESSADRSVSLSLLWSLGCFDAMTGAVEAFSWFGGLETITMPAGSCLVLAASHIVHRTGPRFISAEDRPTIKLDVGAVLREPLPTFAQAIRHTVREGIRARKAQS